jgi:hypothetical protein
MDFAEILVDGFKYPTKDLKTFLVIGILLFIPSLPVMFNFKLINFILLIGIYLILMTLFIIGYSFSIINFIKVDENTKIGRNLPAFKPFTNFIEGIQVCFIGFIYLLIPFILSLSLITTFILIYPGFIEMVADMISNINQANLTILFNSFFSLPSLLFFIVLFLINALIYLIFSLVAIIGIGKFGETKKLITAFYFKEIFKRIFEIGILKCLGLWIVLHFILFISLLLYNFIVIGLFYIEPIKIGFIAGIIILPYIILFASRITALIYNG